MNKHYIPRGEIGCWRVNLTPALCFRDFPTHIFYFRPELVKISSSEKILCREHYYNIGALVTVAELHNNLDLLDYLVSITEDDKLDIQEVLNLAFNLGTFASAFTANGYADTGMVVNTYSWIVEPSDKLMESLMNMYVNRVEGSEAFVFPPMKRGKNPYITEKYYLEIPYEYLEEMFGAYATGVAEHLKYEGHELRGYMSSHYSEIYTQFVLRRLLRYEEMWGS